MTKLLSSVIIKNKQKPRFIPERDTLVKFIDGSIILVTQVDDNENYFSGVVVHTGASNDRVGYFSNTFHSNSGWELFEGEVILKQ